MKTLRAIASIAAAILALVALLLAWVSVDTSTVGHTIEHSRAIDADFKRASAFVDAHLERQGRLPTPKEFETWAEQVAPGARSIINMRLELPPYPAEFTLKHGQPSTSGYALSYWRGEWEETYVSWTRQSSLMFDQSAYFLFGSSRAQTALAIACALCLSLAAFALWPRRQHAA